MPVAFYDTKTAFKYVAIAILSLFCCKALAEHNDRPLSMAPQQITPQLSYGYVATTPNAGTCGLCYEISFSGSLLEPNADAGAVALQEKDKRMVVLHTLVNTPLASDGLELLLQGETPYDHCSQATPYTPNPVSSHFAGLLNSCELGLADELDPSTLKNCMRDLCDQTFSPELSSELNNSCHWYSNFYESAKAPRFEQKQVACPRQLTTAAPQTSEIKSKKLPLTKATNSTQPALIKASPEKPEQYTGVATHFEVFGYPYGGCGVPEDLLETPYFVALNVYDTPNWYEFPVRPLKGDDLATMGEFQNGFNCGRWLEVTIEGDCVGGYNGGEPGKGICSEGGQWVDDDYSGAKLTMLVGDSCGDNNAWCRDSKYHLDLATSSLNNFIKNGQATGDMYPQHWNNRKISWHYVKAPNYSGDIKIHFMKGAGEYWPTILINHLENGIYGVEQWVDEKWVSAERNSDMGQSFILPGINQDTFTIRVRDADNQYINNGQLYHFSFPDTCIEKCEPPATEVHYTITAGTDKTGSTDEQQSNNGDTEAGEVLDDSEKTDDAKDDDQTNNATDETTNDSEQKDDNQDDNDNDNDNDNKQDTGTGTGTGTGKDEPTQPTDQPATSKPETTEQTATSNQKINMGALPFTFVIWLFGLVIIGNKKLAR